MPWVFFSYFPGSWVGCRCNCEGIFQFAHFCSIGSLPPTFIDALVKVVMMVTKDVMQ